MMENTRKLQFAAELLEDVMEDTDTAKVEVECQAMRGTISELRHLCLQERVKNHMEENKAEASD